MAARFQRMTDSRLSDQMRDETGALMLKRLQESGPASSNGDAMIAENQPSGESP
jgi:hypothetical protein